MTATEVRFISRSPATASDAVPNADHYRSGYLGPDGIRLASYREQLASVLHTRASSVLIVGKGDGLVGGLLGDYGLAVTTLDICAELKPDLVGSVAAIPATNARYDAALCCQVLEHLPFEQFSSALRELGRVTRDHLVLSLPDVRRFFSLRLAATKLHLDWQFSLPRVPAPALPQDRFERHGHHWEIGFRGSGFREVCRRIASAGWDVLETRRVSDLPWHTFFRCRAR
jgi:hypothetical protein